MGVGDRFGHQGQAQLEAVMRARAEGVGITPVWNKSYREHKIINTVPMDTRQEDSAVRAHGWREPYFVDADHVDMKTAGTTWLEELIGLAEGGGDGLLLTKEIYRKAFSRFEELCKPYAAVIDIEQDMLPSPDQVDQWDIGAYVSALRHDQTNNQYNPHLRQLLHVGYKIAAEIGDRFVSALKRYKDCIAHNVTENIEKHIQMLFM